MNKSIKASTNNSPHINPDAWAHAVTRPVSDGYVPHPLIRQEAGLIAFPLPGMALEVEYTTKELCVFFAFELYNRRKLLVETVMPLDPDPASRLNLVQTLMAAELIVHQEGCETEVSTGKTTQLQRLAHQMGTGQRPTLPDFSRRIA